MFEVFDDGLVAAISVLQSIDQILESGLFQETGGAHFGKNAGTPERQNAGTPRQYSPPPDPPRDRPKFRVFFFPSPAHHVRSFFLFLWVFSCLFFSVGVFSWNSGRVFEGRDPDMCRFGVLGLSCGPPWGSTRSEPSSSQAKVGLVAIELVLEDEVCDELDQTLESVVGKFSWSPHNLLFDLTVRLVLNC